MKGGQEAIHILIKDLSLYHLASFFSALHVWCRVSWYKASGQIKRNDGKQNQGGKRKKRKTELKLTTFSGLILIRQLLK